MHFRTYLDSLLVLWLDGYFPEPSSHPLHKWPGWESNLQVYMYVANLWRAEASPTQVMSIEIFWFMCIFTVNAHVCYDTWHRLNCINTTVQKKKFYCSRCKTKKVYSVWIWSLQLQENKDFNVEEKGSELIEQQRLQLKWRKDWENVGREIRRGELRRQKKREPQGYREHVLERFLAETEEQREARLMRLSDNQRKRLARVSGWAWGQLTG